MAAIELQSPAATIMKDSTLSSLYQNCYPLAVTSYFEDDMVNNNIEDQFQHLERERLTRLLAVLGSTVFKQIVKSMEKIVEVDRVLVPPATTMDILKEVVYQGEREPCGVRGGTLVVLFSDRLGHLHRVGRFSLDPSTLPTYELHLTLAEDTTIKGKFENLLRKISGLCPNTFIRPGFTLRKRKLYRSSTGSDDFQ